MKNETKICQNCKNEFTIESEDFNFYEKIKVPAPTWCPDCRSIRRLIWRNMRSLYKRNCGLCDKSVISVYKDDGCPVYCSECFNGDAWDPYQYARDVDWSRDLLSQINEIFKIQPRVFQFRIGTIINSDYGNGIANCKNAYMCFSSLDNEDVMYSENIDKSRNTLDSFSVAELEQCSWNMFSGKNYNSHYILSSHSCIDSNFLYNSANCHNCCLSSNLRNQQYVFRNQKLSPEEYHKAVEELRLDTYSGFEKTKNEFDEIYKNSIHKYAQIVSSQNATGDLISNCKNIYKSFDVYDSCEDVRYSMRILTGKGIFDCAYSFSGELIYECMATSKNTFNQKYSTYCNSSKNMEYCMYTRESTDCFACVGLKNAKYCILNKQYSKEEYERMVPLLRKLMEDIPYVDKKGRIYKYGEFFPMEFSPFGYNETVALDTFPIDAKTAGEMDYPWNEREKRNYLNLIGTGELPDSIENVENSILEKAIACLNNGNSEFQCTSAFKIMPEELRFYRDKKLPLPRHCSNCRHYMRLKYRNPYKLWHRKCMKEGCKNEFETSYSPDRPEIVYCERCYQQEVY